MKLLLDTCTFLWLASRPTRLSVPAVGALDDPANELFLSDTSIWEIVLKHFAGKLPLPEPPRVWVPKQTAFFQLQPLVITAEAIYRAGELPPLHSDPFDRLLVAQSMLGAFTVVTPDVPFEAFGARRIW